MLFWKGEPFARAIAIGREDCGTSVLEVEFGSRLKARAGRESSEMVEVMLSWAVREARGVDGASVMGGEDVEGWKAGCSGREARTAR